MMETKSSTRLYQRLGRTLFERSFTGFLSKEQRAKILLGFLALVIMLLAGRLFFLQVVKDAYYKEISEKNRIHPLALPASRGVVTDRNGKIIATNRPAYTVS